MYNANIYLVKWKEGKLTDWGIGSKSFNIRRFYNFEAQLTQQQLSWENILWGTNTTQLFWISWVVWTTRFSVLCGLEERGGTTNINDIFCNNNVPLYIVTQMGEIFSTTLDLSVLWRRSGSSPATSRPGCWSHCPWLLPSPFEKEQAGTATAGFVGWLQLPVWGGGALSQVSAECLTTRQTWYFFLHKEHSHFFTISLLKC